MILVVDKSTTEVKGIFPSGNATLLKTDTVGKYDLVIDGVKRITKGDSSVLEIYSYDGVLPEMTETRVDSEGNTIVDGDGNSQLFPKAIFLTDLDGTQQKLALTPQDDEVDVILAKSDLTLKDAKKVLATFRKKLR